MVNVKQAAVAFGLTAALGHLVWDIAVVAGFADSLVKWKMASYFIIAEVGIAQFSWATALMGIVVCFVAGAVLGSVFAAIWNWAGKKFK
ncbi:MAG TPA: hypothetical protein VLJ21_02300 [Candidatus Binatia bacterium]|nr:hypothetical protein [Candidatus Binatia bacterium]